MDPTDQLSAADAAGLQRGMYADIRTTFRAPIVNSIWRTLSANEPELARYLWGQTKPAFETREFAGFSVAFRDRIISAVEPELPRYDPEDVDVDPAGFAELRGQLATFDTVAPRLAVLFALVTRRLDGRPVGTGEAAAAPFPAWLDADRRWCHTTPRGRRCPTTSPGSSTGGSQPLSLSRTVADVPRPRERRPGRALRFGTLPGRVSGVLRVGRDLPRPAPVHSAARPGWTCRHRGDGGDRRGPPGPLRDVSGGPTGDPAAATRVRRDRRCDRRAAGLAFP